MEKSKKKIITVSATNVSPYELEGTLADIRDQINDWIDKYGPVARLDWDPCNWPQYSNSPAPQYNVMVSREETDEEYKKRLNVEAMQKSAIEERDRKEFDRLQTKFGKK